jgi:hypothetical protein
MKTLSGRAASLLLAAILFGGITFLAPPPASGDEGMWTFDNMPVKQLKEGYNFVVTPEWLEHVRLSSVRFNDGGSGSFVSAHGLVLTNHHVALGQLQKVSTPQKNYVNDGFYARTLAEEMSCPDLELNVLVSTEDVTSRVMAAIGKDMSDKDALKARKAEMARIEKESLDATGYRSDVVSLYAGGEYWLYRYKKYTDIRLVFAPEQQIAFFGGDPDNFTYPRYDLDMALFRVYENDKPIEAKHYLKWSTKGAVAEDLVFVSGHPGSTERLSTISALENQRDHFLPTYLKLIKRRLGVLRNYSERGPEQARQAAEQIFGYENSLKAMMGEYNGLLDKDLMAKKQKEEAEFRALLAKQPELNKKYGGAWDEIAQAGKKQLERLKELRFRSLRGSHMASLALNIVQYVAEVKKPDGERLDGFHESQLESLRFYLLSPAPVYPELEIALLTDSLHQSLEELGANDVFMKTVLNGRSPVEAAQELIRGTKMGDPSVRKQLLEGGESAVAASADPAVVMARKVDPMVRELLKWQEDNIESVETKAGEEIGEARFKVYGKGAYPDATFTLRISYGTVKGYPMNGTQAPPNTTFYGLYDRAYSFGMKPPFNLPARYIERKDRLDLTTPLNFVCSCDIIGGNSGSPVINRDAELVGLIFDGNIESLVGNYVYNGENNRAVAVHSAGMMEALRKLYGASPLADELQLGVAPR